MQILMVWLNVSSMYSPMNVFGELSFVVLFQEFRDLYYFFASFAKFGETSYYVPTQCCH